MNVEKVQDCHEARFALSHVRTSHRRCPARVLKGGRCECNCPFKGEDCPGDHGPKGDLFKIEHERLVLDDGDKIYIWHNHYELPKAHIENLQRYCSFHGLIFEVVKTQDQGDPSVSNWNVCVRRNFQEGN